MKIDIEILNFSEQAVNGRLYIDEMGCATIQLYSKTEPIRIIPFDYEEEQLIGKAETYCKNLYAIKNRVEQVEYVRMNLDLYMRDQIKTKLLDMLSENNIIYGNDESGYQRCALCTPLKTLSGSSIGETVLTLALQDIIVPQLKEGDRIRSHNLPDRVIETVGKQYFHDQEPKYIKKAQLRILVNRPHKKGGPKL